MLHLPACSRSSIIAVTYEASQFIARARSRMGRGSSGSMANRARRPAWEIPS